MVAAIPHFLYLTIMNFDYIGRTLYEQLCDAEIWYDRLNQDASTLSLFINNDEVIDSPEFYSNVLDKIKEDIEELGQQIVEDKYTNGWDGYDEGSDHWYVNKASSDEDILHWNLNRDFL